MDNTALIRLTAAELLKRHENWTPVFLLDNFYNSKTSELVADKENGFFTYSHMIIADLFDAEMLGESKFNEILDDLCY